MATSQRPPVVAERLPLAKVMAFLEIEALPSAGCVAKEWTAAPRMPPAVANWRLRAISDFSLEAGGSEHNFSVRPFGMGVSEDWVPPEGVTIDPWDDDPWALQRQQLLAPFITNSPLRLDLDWRRIFFDLTRIRSEGRLARAREMGLAMTRVGGKRSPEWGGLEREDSDSEDARRGRELRCTYGLAAVREENERFKAWFMRRCYGPPRS
jgi:hypothetical protein